MAVVLRILGCSLSLAGLIVVLAHLLLDSGQAIAASILLGPVGAIVGAVAGAASEIVRAQRLATELRLLELKSRTNDALE